MSKAAEIFSELSQTYDTFIHMAVPVYSDILWATLYYFSDDFQPQTILELGSGTGNVTQQLQERWPAAHITAVDASKEMIERSKGKLNLKQVTFVESLFETLSFEENQYDLVISCLAIHHLGHQEKQTLFQQIYDSLKPGGLFLLSDQVRAINQENFMQDWQHYKASVQTQGADEETVEFLWEHLNSTDKPASVPKLLQWFNNSGFQEVDVLWKHTFYGVLIGRKL